VRDICAARFSDAPHIARGSRFRIRTLYGSASYLCVIPTEAEGPRIIFFSSPRLGCCVPRDLFPASPAWLRERPRF